MKIRILSCSLFLAACAAQPPTPTGGGGSDPAPPPRLTMQLTDAPGPFDKVLVEIAKVEIESATAGWITVVDTPATFDLLQLQNDVTAALGGKDLAPGDYGQLRLLVQNASVVVGGTEQPLAIASGAQTGIKINLDQTLETGMTYSVTLDYNAAQSIKSTGKGYLMTPVIMVKAFTATEAAGAGSGSDAGSAGSGSGSDTLP